MYAHSAAWCQCNSRMPPAVSRIFTPVMLVEIAKSAWVTCRAQPPFWTRRCTVLKEDQICGMPPTSVGGGENADCSRSLIAGSCGPGSVTLAGFLALIAPSGGSSGLPKEPAFAADTVIAAPMADAANRSRLENMVVLLRIDSSASSKLALCWGPSTQARANNFVLTMDVVSPSIFFF